MIHPDVLDKHVIQYPNELAILRRIEDDFDITWGNRIKKVGTSASLYFIKPRQETSDLFGFSQEIILCISDYPRIEARLIQLIENASGEIPALGRIDQTVAIIISKDPTIKNWLADYGSQNPQAKSYVGVFESELTASPKMDHWFFKNKIIQSLFTRDLFDYALPIDQDLFFFGRTGIVLEHLDAIKKAENRGIFGLRKTGKTSVLFKIKRDAEKAGHKVIYIDCKNPKIYRRNSRELLNFIYQQISGTNTNGGTSELEEMDRFERFIKAGSSNKRIVIIFDEIEYIAFNSKVAIHWKNEYISFWQFLWALQSENRKLAYIITGVNPSVVEVPLIDGIQNPMFGIVKSRYLTGLEHEELKALIGVLGSRMGIRFEEDLVQQLHKRYGGHPLLSRIVCSHINNKFFAAKRRRPFSVRSSDVAADLSKIEREIEFYCEHIISELALFYPDEYYMLQMLAIKNIVEFDAFSSEQALITHLSGYGLVDFSKRPYAFKLPVVESYIERAWRRINGKEVGRYIIELSRRREYVLGRCKTILREIRQADKTFKRVFGETIYGESGPSEAEDFAASVPCESKNAFISFVNQCNRSLVEAAKNRRPKDFDHAVACRYSNIYKALIRVRSYRNYMMHLQLKSNADSSYKQFLEEDLDGKEPEVVTDGWFILQECILDNLLLSFHADRATFD